MHTSICICSTCQIRVSAVISYDIILRGGRETLTFGSRIVLAHKEHHTNRLVVVLCICEFIGYTLYILTYLPNSFAPVNAPYRQVRRICM